MLDHAAAAAELFVAADCIGKTQRQRHWAGTPPTFMIRARFHTYL
jgi:hypothetical protein